MRWVVIFVLLLALAGCEEKLINGFVTPVIYETSGYGAHSPVKAMIEYANESGDTINMGEDPDWVDLPWAYYFTFPLGAKPTLYLHVETIEGGDTVRAKIFVDGDTVAQDSGTVVTLTYHP